MRYLMLFFLFFMLACAGNKDQTDKKQVIIPPPHVNCPEGGDCTFEVKKNSSLKLRYDDAGKLYPEIIAGDKIVVKYHYKRDEEKDVMDSSYSEYVYLEFDKNDKQLLLKDKELQKVKMIFGRICFCKNSMGYFRVDSGNLFLFNRNGNLQLRSTFKVNKIPQIITEIDENINY